MKFGRHWLCSLLALGVLAPSVLFAAGSNQGWFCSWFDWLAKPVGWCGYEVFGSFDGELIKSAPDSKASSPSEVPRTSVVEGVATATALMAQTNPESRPLAQFATTDQLILGPTAVTEEQLNDRVVDLMLYMHYRFVPRDDRVVFAPVTTSTRPSERFAPDDYVPYEYLLKSLDKVYDQIGDVGTSGGGGSVDVSSDIAAALAAGPALGNASFTGTTTMADALALGTTTARDLLTVDGAIYLADSNPPVTDQRLYNFNDDLYWNGSVLSSSSTGNWSAGGGDVFRLSGNVGVGNGSPNRTLDIRDNVGGVGLLRLQNTNNTGNAWTQIEYDGGGNVWYTGIGNPSETLYGVDDKYYVYDHTQLAMRMVIDTAGNMGVGTTTPAERLTVDGTARVTGTTTAPLVDSGGTVCDVRAYGAVGDNSTLNDAAIAAAIADCPEGGTVFFPMGEFRIANPIVLDRPVTLRGAYSPRWSYSSTPRSSIRADFGSFSGVAIVHVRDRSISGEVEHNNGGRLEHLSLDGGSASTDVNGIYFEGLVRDWKLTDVDISQVTGNGFEAAVGAGSGNPRGFTIRGLSIYSADGHGFRATALNDTFIDDLLAVGNALRGIYLSSMGETKVANSRAVFNGLTGLYIDGSSNNGGLTFTDFSTDRNDRHGVRIAASGTSTIVFNGLLTRRDGANQFGGGGSETPYAGLAIIGSTTDMVAPVFVSGLAQTIGVDDEGNPPLAPLTGVRVTNAEYVKIDGQLWGVNEAWRDDGGNDFFIIEDDAILKTGGGGAQELFTNDRKWQSTSTDELIFGNRVHIGSETDTRLFNIVDESDVGFRLRDTTNDVTMDARVEDFQAFIGTFSNHQMRFQTNNTSRLTIDLDGDIGIGTTSPLATLDVWGDLRVGTSSPFVFDGQSLGIGVDTIPSFVAPNSIYTDTGTMYAQNVIAAAQLGFGDNTTRIQGQTAGSIDYLNFVVEGSDVMRLTDEGYLGIGTTSPNAKLDVWGDFRVGTGTAPALFTDVSNGFVGINEASPAYALDIDTGTDGGVEISDAATPSIFLGSNFPTTGRQWAFQNFGASGAMAFVDNGVGGLGGNGQVLTLAASGNVGIGTSSPGSTLVLDRDGIQNTLRFTESGADRLFVGVAQSADELLPGTTDNDAGIRAEFDLFFGAGGFANTDMIITTAGNVGIGTSSPEQTLQVFGDIRVGIAGSNGCLEDYGGGVIGGTCASDQDLKTDVLSISATGTESYLERMVRLQPVTYQWNEIAAEQYNKNPNLENLGLIAQDVEEVFPELVSENADGFRQVDFRAFPFYLIEALRELWLMVTGNQERIDELEERIELLESELDAQAAAAAPGAANDDDEPDQEREVSEPYEGSNTPSGEDNVDSAVDQNGSSTQAIGTPETVATSSDSGAETGAASEEESVSETTEPESEAEDAESADEPNDAPEETVEGNDTVFEIDDPNEPTETAESGSETLTE